MDGAYSVSMYYVYGGLECIVSPRFCTGGVLREEASTKVACADCRRKWPLLIVHGLMCGDSFIFFLVFGFLGVFELGAPFRLAPPVLRFVSLRAALDGWTPVSVSWLMAVRCVKRWWGGKPRRPWTN
jgi:hypothetical protein